MTAAAYYLNIGSQCTAGPNQKQIYLIIHTGMVKVVQRIIVIALVLTLSLTYFIPGNTNAKAIEQSEHGLGLLYANPDLVIPQHKLDKIAPASPEVDIKNNTSIRSVINIAGLPPVKSQGSQGSCTAWAVAYYHRTHLEWRERGWDVNLSAHQCSPAFLYHHINAGSDTGSYPHEAMAFICTMGCSSLQEFPYNPNDAVSWPTSTQTYRNALLFRAYDYHYISINTDSGIANLKQHIANGGTAVIAINVYANFDSISDYNNTYCVSEVETSTYRGAHSVTVYGYDDEKQTNDGTGAFRLVNSWGTSWGDAGHFWMSYEAIKSIVTCYGVAYFLTDRTNYTPSLLAEVKIQHNARGEIMWNGITGGIGNTTSPAYSLKILDFDTIQSTVGIALYQRHAFPNCNLVIDLSDGINSINHSAKNNIFVKLKDAYATTTGTIEFLNATDYSWGISNVSAEPPVNIPDAGPYAYANVTLEESIIFEHTPPVSVPQGQDIQIEVHVQSLYPISGIWLYYNPVGESTWYATAMTLISGNATDGNYTGIIPAQQAPGTLAYYFYAVDATTHAANSTTYNTIVEPETSEIVQPFSIGLILAILLPIFNYKKKGK